MSGVYLKMDSKVSTGSSGRLSPCLPFKAFPDAGQRSVSVALGDTGRTRECRLEDNCRRNRLRIQLERAEQVSAQLAGLSVP